MLRKLFAVLSLGCVLTAPSVATGWNDLESMARRWAPAAPQSEWGSAEAGSHRYDLVETRPGFSYFGDGWPVLDGWMRGDPLLRHWVLHRFDLNGDTWLSEPEARTARRTFYAMADGNGSGRMTSEEFVTGWMRVRQELHGFYALDVG